MTVAHFLLLLYPALDLHDICKHQISKSQTENVPRYFQKSWPAAAPCIQSSALKRKHFHLLLYPTPEWFTSKGSQIHGHSELLSPWPNSKAHAETVMLSLFTGVSQPRLKMTEYRMRITHWKKPSWSVIAFLFLSPQLQMCLVSHQGVWRCFPSSQHGVYLKAFHETANRWGRALQDSQET